MKPYPFTPEQLAWLLKLETTDQPQTRGALRRVVRIEVKAVDGIEVFPAGWCCLGIGAETLQLKEYPCAIDHDVSSFSGSSTQLLAYRRLHLRGASGELLAQVQNPKGGEWASTLAELNDDLRWTFPEIAAYIRANPWNVFTDPAAEHDDDCPHAGPRSVESCSCGFYKRDFSHD